MGNKAVVLSLRPEWAKHIFITQDKTFEVRKRAPRIESPYKVYVYCTKTGETIHRKTFLWEGDLNGLVCGEFTCVRTIKKSSPWKGKGEGTCLTDRELAIYSCFEDLYFMEIKDPILYDKPLKLTDIGVAHIPQSWNYCEALDDG